MQLRCKESPDDGAGQGDRKACLRVREANVVVQVLVPVPEEIEVRLRVYWRALSFSRRCGDIGHIRLRNHGGRSIRNDGELLRKLGAHHAIIRL